MANLACESVLQKLPQFINIGSYTQANYGREIITKHVSHEGDPNSFFRLSILKKGNRVQLPGLNNQMPPRAFLPSKVASKISTTNSTNLHKWFPQEFALPVTREAIETSILYCSAPNLKGEIKSCPNSLEEMIEFSKNILDKKQLIALNSESTKGSEEELEIGNVKQFHAKKVVLCHEIFYPFASYFCHFLSSARVYAVDFVEPTTKALINKILGICHVDTSKWAAEHVAFKILKFSPGQGEACHWFSQTDLVWMGNEEKKM